MTQPEPDRSPSSVPAGRAWDLVSAISLALASLTALGYFGGMNFEQHTLEPVFGFGLWLFPFTVLYAGMGVSRSLSRRELRGGWMAWVACVLLFLVIQDFIRRLNP